MGCWYYQWYTNGMLKSVQKPSGAIVSFEYDALGRRTAKIAGKKITRYLWDGNVLLQEWSYDVTERPILQVGELGELFYNRAEPITNLISWIYEQGSFTPIAKLVDGERFSIVSDYLGTPIQAFDSNGELIWERELNIFGGVRQEKGIANFVAMRYQGQYFDEEIELCYNRFRYFCHRIGRFISKDPIGLSGGDNVYAYVVDSNLLIDPMGLTPLDQKGFSVYGLFEEGAKEPYYVGISNNTDLREIQHDASGRLRGNEIMDLLDRNTNMTYAEARGKEQFFIDKYGTKTGKIGQDLKEDGLTAKQRGNKINSFDKARALNPNDTRGKAFKAEYDKATKANSGKVKIKCN